MRDIWRRRGHYEALGDDELAGVLAAHYLSAYQAAPEGEEGEAVAIQARLALRGAADRARALGSYDQVLGFLVEARSVTIDIRARAELAEQAGAAAAELGRYEDAHQFMGEAIDARRALGERPAIVTAVAALVSTLISEYRTAEAEVMVDDTIREFADLDGTERFVALLSLRARALFLGNRLNDAVDAAERALAQADRFDMRETVADLLITKGSALADVNRQIEGLALLRAGLELAIDGGLSHTATRGYVNLTSLLIATDPREGMAVARAGLEVARRIGSRAMTVVQVGNAAELALHTGDWLWAEAQLTDVADFDLEAADRYSVLNNRLVLDAVRGKPTSERRDELERAIADETEQVTIAESQRALSWVELATGDLVEAARLGISSADLYAGDLISGLAMGGRAALWGGDAPTARVCLARLQELVRSGTAIETAARTLEAGVAAADGRRAEAIAGYRAAMDGWRSFDLPFDVALCALDAVLLLGADEPEVRRMGDDAESILGGLGAAPFLARLDAAMGAVPGFDAATSPAAHAAIGERPTAANEASAQASIG